MTTATISNSITKNARPLSRLVPMIRKELRAGFQAGERHWRAVGKLWNEARQHWTQSKPRINGQTFHEWVEAEFVHPWTGEKLNRETVRKWMVASKRSTRGRGDLSLSAHTDKRMADHADYNPKLDWQSGVREVQQRLNLKVLQKEWEDDRQEERETAQLARKIVTAGYRALSAVVHPDKPGGSTEAMSKLTTARKWLEEQIRRYSA